MKKTLILATILLLTSVGYAKQKRPMGNLETNIRLSGSGIQGKGSTPMLLDTLAEDDKFLNDLVGVRKNFDDKEKKDRGRKYK